jgi:hypothetical protein
VRTVSNKSRPLIGNSPIRGLDLFDTVLAFNASDRSISYPRPLSIDIEIIKIGQDLDEIYPNQYLIVF